MDEIVARLQGIFQDVFDDESLEIHDAMTAQDVDEWDSLSHIRLIVAVESAFKVKFLTGEVSSLKNVGEFIRLLKKKLGKLES